MCIAYRIAIGHRVLSGSDVVKVDTDFHEFGRIPRWNLLIPKPSNREVVSIGVDVSIGWRGQ